MSLSLALANAGTGLSAAARSIQVASTNVANAQTPGYAARSVQLAAASLGGLGSGVRIGGVIRQADPVLLDLARGAGGARAQADARAAFWTAVEAAVGLPDAPGSLSTTLAALTSALVAAADRPDLDSRLAAVEGAMSTVAGRLRSASADVQAQRLAADAAIGRDVQALDRGLARLHDLGVEIATLGAAGQPTLDLEDTRDVLLASLAEIVPLKAHRRPDGQLLVYTEGGAVLLDRQPARVGFQPVPGIDAGMTLAGGQLSGLTVNGRAVPTGPEGPLAGGRLGAGFALRDSEGPAVQAALDALAQSLIGRVQNPAADPSATPGTPGLYTDAGLAIGPAPAPGLAGRIAVNPLVQPAAGGLLSRLRDGLGAPVPGPLGDPMQLRRWIDALDRPVATVAGGAARSLPGELDETLSALGQTRQAAVDRATYAAAVEAGLQDRLSEGGVDIDAEMRRLLAIETAYAANARVIRVVDEMLKRLLEI